MSVAGCPGVVDAGPNRTETMYGNCGFAGFFGAGAGAGASLLPVPEPPVEGLVLPVEGALDDDPAELDADVVLEVLVAVDGEGNGMNGSRVEP